MSLRREVFGAEATLTGVELYDIRALIRIYFAERPRREVVMAPELQAMDPGLSEHERRMETARIASTFSHRLITDAGLRDDVGTVYEPAGGHGGGGTHSYHVGFVFAPAIPSEAARVVFTYGGVDFAFDWPGRRLPKATRPR